MLLQSNMNTKNVYDATNLSLNEYKQGSTNLKYLNTANDKNRVDNTYQFHQKLQRNYQLLLMLHKLNEARQSMWGKFLQFQRSKFFIEFQQKFTFKQIFRLRIDDIIYVSLLIIICVVFALLPSQNVKNSIIGAMLVTAYRYMLTFIILGSVIWLCSTNGYRHWIFLLLCVVFPLLLFLTYQGIIPFDQIDRSKNMFQYMHILSLWVVYGAMYVVYPLKQFIRNKIGSLYSYLFALSTLTLLLIWPTYSLIQQISVNMQITFTFITQNKALIITFLIIIILSFHLLTHNTFFQGNLLQTKRLLLVDLTKSELQKALQQIQYQQIEATLKNKESRIYRNSYYSNPNVTRYNEGENNKKISMPVLSPISLFLYRNFVAYSRIMSLIVFIFTAAIQVFVFLYLSDHITSIYRSIGVMVFCVGFLVYGCIMNLLPFSRQFILYFFSVISLVPAALSFLYCNTCSSSSFTFYQYVFLSTSLPYTTIYWCVVRSLSKKRPFFKTNLLVLMYILVHIPLTIFMINSLEMLTSDNNTFNIINMISLGIVGFVSICGILGFIIFLCVSIKQLPKQEQDTSKKRIDYDYWEEGDPMYVPYQKKQSFSLTWLSSLDIRHLAELFNCIMFICCELVTMYMFNQLTTTYSSTNFIFPTTRYIIIAQFYVTFIYFTFAQSYVIFKYSNNENILVIVVLFIIGVAFIVTSYTYTGDFYYFFRISGAASFIVASIAIGLHIVKRNNKQIIDFLSGVLVILMWVLLIVPYLMALPIASLYISSDMYGQFIYGSILATALLIILLVSTLSIVFNTLMNKFQEDKKAKFMTQDVETYLREEGIQTQDQILHVLYQSFQNRDIKYVFFMRKGYPIRINKQQNNGQYDYKTIVYNQQMLPLKESKIKDAQSKDYCWLCLTCICGVDQDQLQQKAQKLQNQNLINQQQMEQLVPQNFFKEVFARSIEAERRKNKQHNYVDLTKLFSSKSIILKHLTKKTKHLGQQYAILKTKRNKRLSNEIWHLIFNFLANEDDYPPAKIILNDFLIFCDLIQFPEQSKNQLNQIFLNFSSVQWKSNVALDINDFSMVVQQLTRIRYQNSPLHEDNKYRFLLQVVYPKLCEYSQFQDVMNERKINATRIDKNDTQFSKQDNDRKNGQRFMGNANIYSLPNQQLQNSPFNNSFQRYQSTSQKIRAKKQKLLHKKAQLQYDKLIQPAKEQAIEPKVKKQQKKVRQKSCKRKIYEKYQQCKSCCKKIEQQQTVIKRKNVKPWDYLAVQSIKILEMKQQQWKQQKKQKQYEFRPIINNILMALFKIADLYTFMEITMMNPVNGWQSARQFGILIIQYRVQLYISFALVLVCGGLGIKGIQYIFQDRLGLTQTRMPAVFPHPMFFFTFIYKLLILSFFNVITMTFLSTFMCDWATSTNNVYNMILDSTNTPLQCFSAQHNIYMICSLVGLLLYYPLSAYTMPNFQFSQKRLDLKYKPSYLIIFFQVNFVMSAGKVLLAQSVSSNSSHPSTIEILFQSLNIFCLALLAVSIVCIKPCLISWFNVVDFIIVWIGLLWNVLGLVLYFTNQWLICIIIGATASAVSILLAIVFIRKKFFSTAKVEQQVKQADLHQLQLGWKYRKQYNVDLIRFQNQNKKDYGNRRQSQLQDEKQYNIDNENSNNMIKKQIKENDNNQSRTIGSMKNNRPSLLY